MPDWDNTPPTAIPPAAAMNNGAPSAIPAAGAPDNTAPTAIPAAGAMNNGAPSAIPAAAAPDNGAPSAVPAMSTGIAFTGDTTNGSAVVASVGALIIAQLLVGMGVRGAGIPIGATITVVGVNTITLSAQANATAVGVALRAVVSASAIAAAAGMNNGAPSAIPAAGAPDNTAPTAIPAAAAMNNGAPSAIAAAAAPDNAAPSAIPAQSGQTNQPPQFIVGPLDPPTDTTVNTPQIVIGGALVPNAIHGQTRIALDSALTRIQVQLDDPPTGGDAVVQLVDGDGQPIADEITIPDGEKFGELVIAAEDQPGLAAGTDVKIKCITPGLTNPGGFGAATLFLQLT